MARSSIELLFTRYLWVPVAGAVIGTGVAVLGGYAVFSRHPVYEASVPFQVIDPAPVVGESVPQNPSMRPPEQVRQIIAQQEFLFQQDKFLDDVLRSAEFHPVDRPNQEIGWLAENKRDPLVALKRDLVLVPHFDAAAFEIRMRARNKAEAFAIVGAAVRVYRERVSSESLRKKTMFVSAMEYAVRDAQADFNTKNIALADYARINGLDVLKSRFDIEKAALQALNQDFTRADAAASGAEQRFRVIQRSRSNEQELPLPAEVQQAVERDQVLASLETARLTAAQEKAQAESRMPTDSRQISEMDARLHALDGQIAERRNQLAESASRAFESKLQDEASNLRFQAAFFGDARRKTEAIVANIGQNLMAWDQRVAEVREAQELVGKLRAQLRMAQANRSVDDTAVMQLDEAVIPQHPVSFRFEPFLIYGAIIGLVLGAFTAVPLSIRRSHRERVPASGPTA